MKKRKGSFIYPFSIHRKLKRFRFLDPKESELSTKVENILKSVETQDQINRKETTQKEDGMEKQHRNLNEAFQIYYKVSSDRAI
jgi:hypothetical protein